MANLRCLANLAQLRTRAGLASSDTGDDGKLLAKLRTATAGIERHTAREIVPYVGARSFDWIDASHVRFGEYSLLKYTSLVDGTGTTAIPSGLILEGGASSGYADLTGPYSGIRINIALGGFLAYATIRERALTVTGVWGWHDDYANAWRPSNNTLTAAITDTVSVSITVSNAAGADGWGVSPALSVGDMIQIDSEWMFVVVITSNALTVVRGVQGSAAATHSNSASIQVYTPPSDLNDICLRWASFLFAQDTTDYGQRVFAPFGGAPGIKIPSGIPPDIYEALESYRNVRV